MQGSGNKSILYHYEIKNKNIIIILIINNKLYHGKTLTLPRLKLTEEDINQKSN